MKLRQFVLPFIKDGVSKISYLHPHNLHFIPDLPDIVWTPCKHPPVNLHMTSTSPLDTPHSDWVQKLRDSKQSRKVKIFQQGNLFLRVLTGQITNHSWHPPLELWLLTKHFTFNLLIAWNLHRICRKFAWDLSEIRLGFVWNLTKICLNMYLRYSWDLS